MSMRTDLAVETAGSLTFDAEGKYEGIRKIERGSAFDRTEIIVEGDESGRKIGKKKGRYLTLEAPRLSHISDRYRDMVSELCEELRSFVGNREKILVAGLGNDDITPDALGPCTASGVMATRHIRGQNTGDSFLDSLKDVSVLLTGVMGTTGIETAEIVKAVYEKTSPDLIIIIDALVCSSPERLGTTIQICDTGISPGSGVENKRMEISEQTLGVPVIAIGVPTIIDIHTIIENITGNEADAGIPDMMVTPKNIDTIISHASRLIATSINLALQPSLDFEDAAEIACG